MIRVAAIDGLAEFQRQLRRVAPAANREFQRRLRAKGAEIRDDARRRYYTQTVWPITRRTGRSPKGIRSDVRFGAVRIKLGDARRPYLVAQEWGSHRLPQFGPPRGRWHTQTGTFFWPAKHEGVRRLYDEIPELMTEIVDDIADGGTGTPGAGGGGG